MSDRTLDTLIDLARDERDSAGQQLAGARQATRQVQQQLQQLLGYRKEYAARLDRLMQDGMDMLQLREYQGFLASIDSAIGRARTELEAQQQHVSRQQQQWQQKQQRLTSFDTLSARREAAARGQEARRERRQQDEMTQNAYQRRMLRQSDF